jgi:peptide deformylase
MELNLTYYGDPVLRKAGARISKITPEIRKLAEDMLETMRVHKGVGLAAQQVGHALQLTVIDITGIEDRPSKMWIKQKEVKPGEHMPLVLINPQIELIKSKEDGMEGCLSFPGISCEISRSKRVKVKAQNLEGETIQFEAAGLLGRAVQHEFDHLQGVLFIDRMQSEDRAHLRDEIEAVRQSSS